MKEQAPYYRYPSFMRYSFIAARRYLHQGQATHDVLWRDIGRLYLDADGMDNTGAPGAAEATC